MPSARQTHIPKHCHHKASNRGVVRLNGRDHYTGVWGTPEAEAEYRRLVAEWLANHRLDPPAAGSCIRPGTSPAVTVADLILAFWRHVVAYYRRADGTPTTEPVNYTYALRPVRELYGTCRRPSSPR